MRVVIKGEGVAALVTLVALLCASIFYKLSRSDESDMTVPLIGGLPLSLMRIATDESAATLTTRRETVPGVGDDTTVFVVSADKPVANPWHISVSTATNASITKDEPLAIVFLVRSAQSVIVAANFEESKTPYTKSVCHNITTTGTWQAHSVPFRAMRDFAVGEGQVTFHCGFQTGVVEIAGIQLRRDKP